MTDGTTGPASTTPSEDDDDGSLNFADKYRPDTFAKVVGQESAVACLSGLIRRNRKGRSILLHGSVGSGKTTLARIYARALNCQATDPKDSPCYRCECETCGRSGQDPIKGFREFNVSANGGGKDAVEKFLDEHYHPETEFRYRILFFDEAHALTNQACDLLLNHVEEPKRGVLFFFATTEAERLRPALRSRLFDLLIRPLSTTQAIEFLREAADKEHIVHEPGALELLAGLRNGFPRDLLLGLERVWEPDSPRLEVKHVRAAFDVDQTEILVEYFTALADGDFDLQTELAFNWRERAVDKIRWIQAFLLHLYHNEILGRCLVVDGVIEAIPERTRRLILEKFCRRLGLADDADLAAYWRRLMEFWPVPETATDETALGLRLTLFHRLVNAGPVDEKADTQERGDRPGPSVAVTPMAVIGTASRGFGPPPAPRPGAPVVAEDAGHLTPADVRRIVNSASFLAQGHGILFNAAFEVRPALAGVEGTAAAAAAIGSFRDDLAAQAKAWDGELRASITVLERDGSGVVGRVVAHLHAPDPLDLADPDGLARTAAWARAWRGGAMRVGGGAVEYAPVPWGDKAALNFHWGKVLDLCAGLDGRVEAWDPAAGRYRPLFELLRVRLRRAGPVLGHALVEIPAPLSDEAVAEACRNRLEPLSAFDDEAWGEITTGWELKEFSERQRICAERDREIAEVFQRFGEGTPEAQVEIDRAVSAWRADPRRRRRRSRWPARS